MAAPDALGTAAQGPLSRGGTGQRQHFPNEISSWRMRLKSRGGGKQVKYKLIRWLSCKHDWSTTIICLFCRELSFLNLHAHNFLRQTQQPWPGNLRRHDSVIGGDKLIGQRRWHFHGADCGASSVFQQYSSALSAGSALWRTFPCSDTGIPQYLHCLYIYTNKDNEKTFRK